MTKRWFHFAYAVKGRLLKDGTVCHARPHQLRDGDAAAFLAGPLARLGYEFAGPLINYPHRVCYDPKGERPERPRELIRVSLLDHGVRPGDLLVLATRPPMDDMTSGDKSASPRSFTAVEDELFETALRPHLECCSRTKVDLTHDTATRYPGAGRYRRAQFHGESAAMISCQPDGLAVPQPLRRDEDWTLAYMLYRREALPGGPGLLTLFGMGGVETLAWASLVARRFPNRVADAEFTMALLKRGKEPYGPAPATLAFADKWTVNLLS